MVPAEPGVAATATATRSAAGARARAPRQPRPGRSRAGRAWPAARRRAVHPRVALPNRALELGARSRRALAVAGPAGDPGRRGVDPHPGHVVLDPQPSVPASRAWSTTASRQRRDRRAGPVPPSRSATASAAALDRPASRSAARPARRVTRGRRASSRIARRSAASAPRSARGRRAFERRPRRPRTGRGRACGARAAGSLARSSRTSTSGSRPIAPIERDDLAVRVTLLVGRRRCRRRLVLEVDVGVDRRRAARPRPSPRPPRIGTTTSGIVGLDRVQDLAW